LIKSLFAYAALKLYQLEHHQDKCEQVLATNVTFESSGARQTE